MTPPKCIGYYIWERLQDESERAYRAFYVYLEFGLGNRSFKKVLQKLGKKRSYIKQLQRWSSRYSWVSRVEAYDQHVIEQHREKHYNERLQMYKEHAEIYAHMQSIGFEGLKKRLESDPDSITTHQLIKIAKNAMDTERKAQEGLLTASMADSAERDWLETPLIDLVQDDPEAYEHFKALEEIIKRRSKKGGSVKSSLIYRTS